MDPLSLGAGIIAGAILSLSLLLLLVVRPARRRAEALAIENARIEAAAGRVQGLEEANEKLRGEVIAANTRLAETTGTLETERKSHAARLEELERMGAEIENKFAVLAADALGKNAVNFLALVNERFEKHKQAADQDLESRQKAIEALVAPLREGLGKFDQQISEIEKARAGAYEAITQQVRALADGQTLLRTETGRLVQALRTPKTRGRWGELQLRTVLELAGMTENVDFIEQATVEVAEASLRPDVVLRLPGGKSIIVDAKTPLDAYLSALEADDDPARVALMLQHVRQVRDHIRTLGSKEYWKGLPVTPDFVVMFVPGEPFLAAAMEQDSGLFEQALRSRVFVATPMTFIALVKAIAYGWQQENLTKNAQAVADQARDLYDRIKVFGEHIMNVGSSLRQTVDRYNKAVGSLEGRVLPGVRRFEQLGVVPVNTVLPEITPVEIEPRALQAAELLPAVADDGGEQP